MMKSQRILKPGQPGTRQELKKYGDKLLCVRYRVDPDNFLKYKTVEIIESVISNRMKRKSIPPNKKIDIRLNPYDSSIRKIVIQAGGHWDPKKRVWQLSYRQIINLGLEKYIIS
ncbi:MAG: hypothetical protein EHM28_14300 [Spirochaetaceae bacterium]|nr:MAG: hypothetical protein EHM28_14300 [Spirochaetaceae bacterium]